jgi:hypothetical protein
MGGLSTAAGGDGSEATQAVGAAGCAIEAVLDTNLDVNDIL